MTAASPAIEHPNVELRYEPTTGTLRMTFGEATDAEDSTFVSVRSDACVVKIDPTTNRIRALLFREDLCGLFQRLPGQPSRVSFAYNGDTDVWCASFAQVPVSTEISTSDPLSGTSLSNAVLVDRCGEAIVSVEVFFVRRTTGARFVT